MLLVAPTVRCSVCTNIDRHFDCSLEETQVDCVDVSKLRRLPAVWQGRPDVVPIELQRCSDLRQRFLDFQAGASCQFLTE